MSSTSQPAPVIDVLPSILFAPRLARKAPQVFQGKQGLGLDDLVFVGSQIQDFAITTADRLPHEIKEREPNDHEIVAAICQPKRREDNGMSRTEIRFSHGKSWKAIALRSGAYEFVSQEGGETQSIARWIPKKEVNAERSADMQNQCKSNSQRFKFSLIDSRCRRHPVIANMSRQSIDIYDRYTIPSVPRSPSKYTDAESLDSADFEGYDKTEFGDWDEYCKTMIETDGDLRTTIAITGVWVALCEGWSPNFKYGTRQVISNGVSELSNRRRSDSTQSVSSVPYELHDQHQLEWGNGSRARPGVIHTSSLSSVPSSTSLSSPLMSPRRRVSSYTSDIDHDAIRRRAPDERDDLRDPTISDIGSDVEQEGSQRSSLVTNAPLGGTIGAEKEAGTGDDISVGADALPIETRHERKQSRQDMVSDATTLVDKESKKSSKLRRMIARLRRTKRAR
ncbi:MAG: hypothetical protein Q9210_004355 [Variospora velana]